MVIKDNILDVGNRQIKCLAVENQSKLVILLSPLLRIDFHFLFQLIGLADRTSADERNDLVLAIGRRVVQGLRSLHTAGFVHCDLKPANVLLRRAGPEVAVCDFGAARRIGSK